MKEVFEKIIEKFKKIGNIQFSSFTKPLITVEDAIKIVEETAAEYNNNGWIPCNDGSNMPEPHIKVLVTYKAYDGIKSCEGRYNGIYWYDSATRTKLNAIAWQPLPSPYQQEGGEAWRSRK